MIAITLVNGSTIGFAVAIAVALYVITGCNSTTTPDQTCAAPYPTTPAACDASAQCFPAACTCNDGTMSAFARGNLCNDAGACDPEKICTGYCITAGGLQSMCR